MLSHVYKWLCPFNASSLCPFQGHAGSTQCHSYKLFAVVIHSESKTENPLSFLCGHALLVQTTGCGVQPQGGGEGKGLAYLGVSREILARVAPGML